MVAAGTNVGVGVAVSTGIGVNVGDGTAVTALPARASLPELPAHNIKLPPITPPIIPPTIKAKQTKVRNRQLLGLRAKDELRLLPEDRAADGLSDLPLGDLPFEVEP